MTFSTELFDQAVLLARSGERARARSLFRQVVTQNPDNAQAWLWLSDLSDTLEEQTEALEHSLALRSKVDTEGQLQDDLVEMRGAIPLGPPLEPVTVPAPVPAKLAVPAPRPTLELLNQAERLAIIGKHAEAIQMLREIVEYDPSETHAWMLLAELGHDPAERVQALEKVLALDSRNAEALHLRDALLPVLEDPLQRGTFLEENGQEEQAIQLYQSLIAHSRSASERVQASRRIAQIQVRQEAHRLQPVNPTLTLLRLSLGPVILFITMLFIQSGMNVLRTFLFSIPGVLFVLAGSLLLAITEMRPMHPQWIQFAGKPGTGNELSYRHATRFIGWVLMMAPFTFFLVSASLRLGALQSAMVSAH